MKQYGSYSDADLTDWERLPLPSKVLTESAFGAWLMRRDEHRDKAMNLIPKSILEDIRAEIEQVSFTHYFEYGEYYGEDTREERIVNLDAVMKIIDKYKESEVKK